MNMSKGGLDILCYNFMPVVDWTRTDLEFEWSNGARALKFDFDAFAVFDIYLMRRQNAEKNYSEEQLQRAKHRNEKMTTVEKSKLSETILKGLPGRTSEAYTMSNFKKAIEVWAFTLKKLTMIVLYLMLSGLRWNSCRKSARKLD